MTEIRLWNTATKTKVALAPLDAKNVRMYVCGPTVYDRAHIGNARPVVVFDVLYRLLRHKYGADAVTYVRNFTDVDDKINARAAETGRSIREITDETIQWYLDDMDALGALRPGNGQLAGQEKFMPRCTEYIGHVVGKTEKGEDRYNHMIGMIQELEKKGNAYPAEGHVLFDVTTYDRYGKLSNRALDDMIAGARVEVAPYKRNPMDFVVWKPSDASQPGWDSPWGRGRPGWHIECSAMAKELLGEHFDIHAGGIDLLFPHHENELAQSNCLHGGEMAQVWMHNGFLEVEGQKMSKSFGNFFTVRDLLDKGYPGEVIRAVLLSRHYRKPMDWTEKKAAEAEKMLRGWWKLIEGVEPAAEPHPSVLAALAEDLDTRNAIQKLRQLASAGKAAELLASARLLGLLEGDGGWRKDQTIRATLFVDDDSFGRAEVWLAGQREKVEALVARRADAKKNKDFALADQIRNELAEAGLILADTPDGKTTFRGSVDPAKLEVMK